MALKHDTIRRKTFVERLPIATFRLRIDQSDMDFIKRLSRTEKRSINMTIGEMLKREIKYLTGTETMIS